MTIRIRTDYGAFRVLDYTREGSVASVADLIEQQVEQFSWASMKRVLWELNRRLMEGAYDE